MNMIANVVGEDFKLKRKFVTIQNIQQNHKDKEKTVHEQGKSTAIVGENKNATEQEKMAAREKEKTIPAEKQNKKASEQGQDNITEQDKKKVTEKENDKKKVTEQDKKKVTEKENKKAREQGKVTDEQVKRKAIELNIFLIYYVICYYSCYIFDLLSTLFFR